jgi:3-deoxy-D-manno-octulosonic-acid transferase
MIQRSERWRQQWLLQTPDPVLGCVWVHACSVGEVASVIPLIEQLLQRGKRVHLTVVTRTGMAHAQRVLGERISCSFLPWDMPGFMRYFVGLLQPSLLLLTETEFWPGMLAACGRKNIPVIGINTRISDRSFPRYFATRYLWRRWLAPVNQFLPQSEQDSERLAALGIDPHRIQAVGNLKYAITAPVVDATAMRRRLDPSMERPIVLCASTHDDEEQQLLRMFRHWRQQFPQLLMVMVPRHPERFDGVATVINEQGFQMHRWRDGDAQTAVDVLLVDAMGVLTALYAVADVVFIGGSLANVGGHNPLEAAICGRGAVMGSHVQNFRHMVADLQREQAILIGRDAQDVQAIITRLLQHHQELRQLHAHAAQFMQGQARVLDAVMENIEPYLSAVPCPR